MFETIWNVALAAMGTIIGIGLGCLSFFALAWMYAMVSELVVKFLKKLVQLVLGR